MRVFQAGIGDANGDGKFDSGDLVTVFQPAEYEDSADDNSTWTEGNWNGDLDFDSGDLVDAFQTGSYESPTARIVPEPSTTIPRCILLLMAIARSRLSPNTYSVLRSHPRAR